MLIRLVKTNLQKETKDSISAFIRISIAQIQLQLHQLSPSLTPQLLPHQLIPLHHPLRLLRKEEHLQPLSPQQTQLLIRPFTGPYQEAMSKKMTFRLVPLKALALLMTQGAFHFPILSLMINILKEANLSFSNFFPTQKVIGSQPRRHQSQFQILPPMSNPVYLLTF